MIPTTMHVVPSIEDRLASKIDKNGPGGCWLFTGCLDTHGYGLLWDNRRKNNSRAHRLAYEFWVGPVSEGDDVHHECHVRACCNPAHLATLPAADHTAAHNPRGTHCAKGHPFTKANARQQVCVECAKDHQLRYRSANRDRINALRRQRRKEAKRAG